MTSYLRWTLGPAASRRPTVAIVLAGLLFCALAADAQPRPRPKEPRIAPADSQTPLNILKTMARHPKLAEAWQPFGGYILRGSTLPARDRELLILRTAWLCGTEYEWGYHSRSAKAAGVSDEELARVQIGHLARGWSSFERGLMRAADQLHNDEFITKRTWGTLKARYSDEQMMDVVFTVGQYTMVSMAINSFGVQRDEGVEGFPKED